ncbi:hypothetical protein [Pseudomonas sp. S2_H01]
MINANVPAQPRAHAPRPYHQKMLVTVTRTTGAEVNTESLKKRVYAVAGVSQDKLTSSASIKNPEPDEYQESFARMMVNLPTRTPDSQATASSIYPTPRKNADATKNAVDSVQKNDVAESRSNDSESLNASTSQPKIHSARNDFMDYMNQTDAEKLRQELTGVTKEQYDQMSPEEKLAVDEKLEQLLKKKQEIAQVQLKAKIALAKTMDSQAI